MGKHTQIGFLRLDWSEMPIKRIAKERFIRDASEFRGCPIIRDFSDTFICFQPHINIMAFINKKTPQPKLAISLDYS